jgi:diguanylate cyclase (GGDEF)-like protein
MPLPRFLPWLAALLAAQVAFGQAPHPAQTLVERSSQAQRDRPEESQRLAREALALLAQQPDADLEVRARTALCSYLSERDRTAAEREVAAAEALTPKLRHPGLRAGPLGCQGEIHEFIGDNLQAMSFYQQAVSVAEAAADLEMLAGALFQRGYLRGLQGDYASGLADLRRAQALYEQLELPHQAAGTLNGIAIVYNRMGDFAQARDFYRQTLIVQRAAGLLREQAVTWHNLGRANENLGIWDEARQAFESALGLCREIDYVRGEAYALRGLASVRNAQGDPAAALALLAQSEALQRQTPDTRLRAQIQLQRGIALRLQKHAAASLAALDEALAIFKSADSQAELVTTYSALAQTQAELGDWRAAYDMERDFKAASDRLLQRQLDQRFATLKVEFDSEAKDKENRLLLRERDAVENALEQARKASRLQVVAIVLAGLLTLVLAAAALRLRRATGRMHTLAMTDELTGLPNRRAVLKRLGALLAQPGAPPFAVMIADLDHFKPINDRLGHGVGDDVLRAVGSVLTEAVREPVFVGRLGGEEFLVVLPETGLDAARQAAERIREQIAAIDCSRWFTNRGLTVSLGVTVTRLGGDTQGNLLRRADAALYEAKHSGRNRVALRAAPDPNPAVPTVLPA